MVDTEPDMKTVNTQIATEVTRNSMINMYSTNPSEIMQSQIEPKSQDFFGDNYRDIQLSNMDRPTEFYILRVDILIDALKFYGEQGNTFSSDFYLKYLKKRDFTMLLTNSRGGFLRRNIRSNEQIFRQPKDNNAVSPTKPIWAKPQRNYDDFNQNN